MKREEPGSDWGRGLRGIITKLSAPSICTHGLWLPLISGPRKQPETGRDKPLPSRPAPAAEYTLKIAAGRDVLKIKNF